MYHPWSNDQNIHHLHPPPNSEGRAKSSKAGAAWQRTAQMQSARPPPTGQENRFPPVTHSALLTDSCSFQSAVFFQQEPVVIFQTQHKFICLKRKKICILSKLIWVSHLIRILKGRELLPRDTATIEVPLHSHYSNEKRERISSADQVSALTSLPLQGYAIAWAFGLLRAQTQATNCKASLRLSFLISRKGG